MTGTVPQIETARLILRGHREDDLDAQAHTMADLAVVRHLGGTPFTREDTWRRILSARGLWAMFGYGYWAVERKEDAALIGQIGFSDFKRWMTPAIEGLPEMGWIFAPAAHGQGFALEAATAALAWADGSLAGREIVAIIDPDNAPSIRLAERIGFSTRGSAIYRDAPILLFRRPAASRP